MPSTQVRAATGIPGLDDILLGGFVEDRLYLVEGMPGSGKTTLAFQFLLEGARCGEPVLYMALSETEEEMRAVAESHGWSLEGVEIRELLPSDEALEPEEQYTVFHPSEVELSDTTRRILQGVDKLRPKRVVFDSLSELRLLAGNALRYRRQILALKRFFAGRHCTVLLLDDLTAADRDLQVQSIAHGSLHLEHGMPDFGGIRRRLCVKKYRGSNFRDGYHNYAIRHGGLTVFPRLVAAEYRRSGPRKRMRSGIDGLDKLIGGGLECGTSTLLLGQAGTGKSTIAALFCTEAAEQGHNSAMFIFDESTTTLLGRMDGLHIPLRKHVEAGCVSIRQVDPAEFSPGELVHCVRQAVEEHRSAVIVLDSLNGYLNSMPNERFLIVQLHELLTYLGHRGVASILVSAQRGLIGDRKASPVDASYLADGVMLLRYFEAGGEIHQALSVMKMRGSRHERSIREFSLKEGRVHVGEPLRSLRGVLSGVPEAADDTDD